MWSFPKLGPQQNNESPKLDEFFNSQDAATSLVREALQNSLDAALNKDSQPVRVKFDLATHTWSKLKKYFQTHESDVELADHTRSDDLGKFAFDSSGLEARCLLVQDSGTKGLTGSTDKSDAKSGSNFVGFWWNRGITGKTKGSSGSHGVGKTTLTRASRLATFLAITKRSDDDQVFLIGFSNLPYHRIEDKVYAGYGRYGILRKTDEGTALDPVTEKAHLSSFEKDFGVDRHEPGLSILIPHIVKSIDHDSIAHAVLSDYYWPILNGALEVEIKDSDLGQITQIDASSIVDLCNDLDDSTSNKIIRHTVNFACEALKIRSIKGNPRYFPGTAVEVVSLDNGSREGRVTKNCFTPQNLDLLKSSFQNGEMIGVGLSFPIEPVEGDAQSSLVDVFLQKEESSEQMRIAQYIRNQIVISNEKSNIQHRFSCALLVAEDEAISEYLKVAEEPAHTNWYIGRLKSERLYKNEWQLRFVKSAMKQLFNVIMGFDEDEVVLKGVAADIFSVLEPAPSKNETKKKAKSGSKQTKTPKVEPQPRKSQLLHVAKDPEGTGFSITPVKDFAEIVQNENVELPIQLDVKAAYLSVRGNARSFKDFSKLDFDFEDESKIQLQLDGSIGIAKKVGNQLSLAITGSEFSLSARGFDPKRDLLLRSKINV